MLSRLRLEEELTAINKDMDDSWSLDILGTDPVTALEDGDDKKKTKLSEFPELEAERLKECVGKYKSAGLRRKQTYAVAAQRLKDEGCTTHQQLDTTVFYIVIASALSTLCLNFPLPTFQTSDSGPGTSSPSCSRP